MRTTAQIKSVPVHDAATAVWAQRYRASERDEPDLEATFARVAAALAAPESRAAEYWFERFFAATAARRFIPGGRILAAAGLEHDTTLANCFVMGTLEDSVDGIFSALKESAMTLQAGGGIGIDFSPLRPRGTIATRTGQTASGAVSFLHIWNQMSETMMSTNPRRGAMMGVLDCSHPDILEFIAAKRDPAVLNHFNISVLVSNEFMQALEDDGDWYLRFDDHVVSRTRARDLWRTILENNRAGGEPGVLFIDRINARNRLNYCETIRATNPCGELPLPPHGACLLGSLILPHFVIGAFERKAQVDWRTLEETVRVAVRMLDNAVGMARFPLEKQREKALHTRRLGIGVTGLADMLIMLNQHYGSDDARDTAAAVMRCIRDTAYLASSELAKEKGSFPALDIEAYLNQDEPHGLPEHVRAALRDNGLRNSHLTAIAPTGSISLLADNVSSGIEPAFDWTYRRRFTLPDGTVTELKVEDYAWKRYRERSSKAELPQHFVTGSKVSAQAQIEMIACLQPFVDSGISKTVGLPATAAIDEYDALYRLAWQKALKGMTTFPENAARGAVLLSAEHCNAGSGIRCD